MSRVRVSTTIDAPRDRVWAAVRDIASHVEWMEDAIAIHFTSRSRRGVGTTFDCDTRVGPFRLTGTGRFTLDRRRHGRTRFTWDERLTFPLWMGAWPGSVVGGAVLRRVWKRNLRNLKARVEGTA